MKVIRTNTSLFSLQFDRIITDEYVRRHEQELLRKMKESVSQSIR